MSTKLNAISTTDHQQQFSIKELAEANQLDYLEAQGFLKTLIKLGQCKLVSQRKQEGQRGKPTNVYQVPNNLIISLVS